MRLVRFLFTSARSSATEHILGMNLSYEPGIMVSVLCAPPAPMKNDYAQSDCVCIPPNTCICILTA